MAVEAAPEQKLPANSPNSGAQAGIGGEEPLREHLSQTSSADLDSMAPQDQDSQLQPNVETAVEVVPQTMSPMGHPVGAPHNLGTMT
jgi:hypothetical protein